MDNYSVFEKKLAETMKDIRDRLGDADIPRLRLDIEVCGETLHGDLKITFKLGTEYSSSSHAEGGDLSEVVSEFIRRKSWARRNAPICLPRVESKDEGENSDKMPF